MKTPIIHSTSTRIRCSMILVCIMLTTSFASFGQARAKLQFDGLYQTALHVDSSGENNYYYYLRFYADGQVISTSSTGTVDDLKKWFNIKHKYSSHGHYTVSGTSLSFSTTSANGTVVYNGKIVDGNLELSNKSLINGFTGNNIYYFIKVPHLK